MGDRSTIALLESNGIVKSIYTHWQGFISGNGAMLYEYYRDIEVIKELMSLGDAYILHCHLNPPLGVEHNVNKPYVDVSIFYNRDCTNPNEETATYSSFEDYLKNGHFQADNYIFDEKQNLWFVLDRNNHHLTLLSSLLLKDLEVSIELKNIIKEEEVTKNMHNLDKKIPEKNSFTNSKKQKV